MSFAAPSDAALEELLQIAKRAATLVMEVYASDFKVELKGPNDPVTRADREANAQICDELARKFPDAAIIAEESAPEGPEEIEGVLANETVFLVDPVDGTREFADKNGEFAIMIGQARHGRAELGVLVLPALGLSLAGRVGSGAFIEDLDGERHPVELGTETNPARARLVHSRSHKPRIVDTLQRELGIKTLIPCGSVGVKVARVLEGKADLYVHGGRGISLWDACAPEAVLRAAGGAVTDLTNNQITYRGRTLGLRQGFVAAANAALHQRVLETVGRTV